MSVMTVVTPLFSRRRLSKERPALGTPISFSVTVPDC